MKTYKNEFATIKCYTNTPGTKYFIKVEHNLYTAKFEFSDKDAANNFFKANINAFPGLKIKVH